MASRLRNKENEDEYAASELRALNRRLMMEILDKRGVDSQSCQKEKVENDEQKKQEQEKNEKEEEAKEREREKEQEEAEAKEKEQNQQHEKEKENEEEELMMDEEEEIILDGIDTLCTSLDGLIEYFQLPLEKVEDDLNMDTLSYTGLVNLQRENFEKIDQVILTGTSIKQQSDKEEWAPSFNNRLQQQYGNSSIQVVHTLALEAEISSSTTPVKSKFINSVQSAQQLQSMVLQRINKHWQCIKAKHILSLDGDQEDIEKNFEELLQKLHKYSAQSETGTLLAALTERKRDCHPPFLTERDFHDRVLECEIHQKMHAVYALTITVPKGIYNSMLLDDTVNGLDMLQPHNVDIDGNMVYVKGKIGETTNLQMRTSGYYSCQHRNDSISKIVNFLRKEEGNNSKSVHQMVRIRPILSGGDLSTVDSLVQMETLCSMLIGREGNHGFNYIGRFTGASKEELRRSVTRLHQYMATEITLDDGTVVRRSQLVGAAISATLMKKFIGQDGVETTIAIERGAVISATLMRTFIGADGEETTRGKEIGALTSATLMRTFIGADGEETTRGKEIGALTSATLMRTFIGADGEETTRAALRVATIMKKFIGADGEETSLAIERGALTSATLMKKFIGQHGEETSIAIERGAAVSATLMKKFIGQHGEETSIAIERGAVASATLMKKFIGANGEETCRALEIAHITTINMVELDDGRTVNTKTSRMIKIMMKNSKAAKEMWPGFLKLSKIDQLENYVEPTDVFTTKWGVKQFGWKATCPVKSCGEIWCVCVSKNGKALSHPVCGCSGGKKKKIYADNSCIRKCQSKIFGAKKSK